MTCLGYTESADQFDLLWKAVVTRIQQPEKAEGETEIGAGKRQGVRSSLIVFCVGLLCFFDSSFTYVYAWHCICIVLFVPLFFIFSLVTLIFIH